MEIRAIDNSSYCDYINKSTEYGSVFNRVEWLKTFGNNLKIYGIFDNGNMLIGGFHLYVYRHFGFTWCRCPLFTPSIGPFLEIKSKNHVAILDTWKRILTLMADFLNQFPCSILTLSLDQCIVDTQPFIWKSFKVNPAYTYIINLSNSVDEIQKNMSPEKRNDIKKAIKDGLFAKQITDFNIVKSLVKQTFHRQKTHVNEFYLDKVLFDFSKSDNSYAFCTFSGERPIATCFCVHDGKKAYYIFGGIDEAVRHHGAGPLAVWESIKHAHKLCLKYFDFEGSMIPQIESYLRGFGGQLTPYYKINKAKLPIEILLKFFKREMF